MIDSVFVWVDGPSGSGKTLLIERVLQANRSKRLGAVRFRKRNSRKPPDEVKRGNDETRRYKSAGAERVMLFEYPAHDDGGVPDSFFCSGFLDGTLNAVYCEGEVTNDTFPMDLTVFVLPPLSDLTVIFEKQVIPVDDDFMRKKFNESFGHLKPIMKSLSISFDDCIEQGIEHAKLAGKEIPPLVTLRLVPPYEGLIVATSIIVNIRDETERPAAEKLLEFIGSIDSAPNTIENTLGYFWRQKKSTFVANLSDPKDPQTKKVIAMIKRRFVDVTTI